MEGLGGLVGSITQNGRSGTPEVSFVMPAYNEDSVISEAIESVLSQTMTDFELIVVDDGSTDDTVAMAEGFADRDHRVRVVHNSHLGAVAALNTGVKLARGRFIARQDADDMSHPRRLELQHRVIVSMSASMVTAGHIPFRGEFLGWNEVESPCDVRWKEYMRSDVPRGNTLTSGSMLIDREALVSIGGFSEKAVGTRSDEGPLPATAQCEDFELIVRLASSNHVILDLESKLYAYRIKIPRRGVYRRYLGSKELAGRRVSALQKSRFGVSVASPIFTLSHYCIMRGVLSSNSTISSAWKLLGYCLFPGQLIPAVRQRS